MIHIRASKPPIPSTSLPKPLVNIYHQKLFSSNTDKISHRRNEKRSRCP